MEGSATTTEAALSALDPLANLARLAEWIFGENHAGTVVSLVVICFLLVTQWQNIKAFFTELLPHARKRRAMLSNLAHAEQLLSIAEKQEALKIPLIDTSEYAQNLGIGLPIDELGTTAHRQTLRGGAQKPSQSLDQIWSTLRRIWIGLPLLLASVIIGFVLIGLINALLEQITGDDLYSIWATLILSICSFIAPFFVLGSDTLSQISANLTRRQITLRLLGALLGAFGTALGLVCIILLGIWLFTT